MIVNFVGDTCINGKFKLRADKGESIVDDNISDYLHTSDFNVCNLEGPITSEVCSKSVNLNVKTCIKDFSFLKQMGFNCFGLANNHIFDAGEKGFKDTVDLLDSNNMLYSGAGKNLHDASKPMFLEGPDGVKISIICVGHPRGVSATRNKAGIFSYSDFSVQSSITSAKENSDWVIVYCHCGPEYNFIPTPSVMGLFDNLTRFGADIIIGHHPHVFQGVKRYQNKMYCYSLGNFIFDISTANHKKDYSLGLLLNIRFTKTKFTYNTHLVKNTNGLLSFADHDLMNILKKRSNLTNYKMKSFYDSFRVLFLNFGIKKYKLKSLLILLFFPVYIAFRVYVLSGYDREFFSILLKCVGFKSISKKYNDFKD